jgi:enoyl-CoA hydratase/carnithine racemase
MPECVAGFIPDNGASRFFAKLRGGDLPLGLYLAIIGQRVSGRNLLKWGLCSHFVRKERLEDVKKALLGEIRRDSTLDDIK